MNRIAPGIYLSADGDLIRIEIPEIVKEIGVTDNAASRRAISRHFQKLFKNMFRRRWVKSQSGGHYESTNY